MSAQGGKTDNPAEQHRSVRGAETVPSITQPDTWQKDADSRRTLSVCVNTNQFYMQGFSGVLDLLVRNNGAEPLDAVEIRLSGKVAPTAQSGIALRLEAGETKRRALPIVEPASGGIEVVGIELRVRKGVAQFVFGAEATLTILERLEKASDIQINADNLVNLGHTGERFNVGGVINVDISEMIRAGRIKTANDFMQEYRKLSPEFKELSLELQSSRMISDRRFFVMAAVVLAALVIVVTVVRTVPRHAVTSDGVVAPGAQTGQERDVNRLTEPAARPPDARPAQAQAEGETAERPREGPVSLPPDANSKEDTSLQARPVSTPLIESNQMPPRDPELDRAVREVKERMNRGFLEAAQERLASALQSYPDNAELKGLAEELDRRQKEKERADELKPRRENEYQ